MFNFFKKNERQVEVVSSDSHTLEEKVALESRLLEIKNKITQDSADDSLASLYEQMGILLSELGQKDEAILSFEQSLDLELSTGPGYKILMSLYNEKRAQAAKSGNYQEIDYYMSKMDEMRNIAKIVTLGGHKKG